MQIVQCIQHVGLVYTFVSGLYLLENIWTEEVLGERKVAELIKV